MTDRELDNYLALLGGMLRLRRTQRDHIAGELRDHLIEHVAHLEASGITHEEAVRRALEEFGDAAALAASFSALVGMRRRRLIMRCTIGTTVVMTGLVVAMLAFRPPVIDDPQVAMAQAKSGKGSESGSGGAVQPHKPANSDEATRRKLRETTDAEFNEVPLRDALGFLADKHAVQFYLDPRSLNEAGIANDSPVTINLHSVPLEMLLSVMLREHQLGYRVRNGVIMIASESDVQSQTEVRVYPVPEKMADELASLIPATIATDHWREPVRMNLLGGHAGMMGATMMGGGGMQGMGGVPGLGGGGMGGMAVTEPAGGMGPGMIRVFRGTLVISQTPEVHQKIEKLIEDLAAAGAMDPRAVGSSDSGGGGYGSGAGRGGFGASSDRSGYGTTADRGGYGSTGDPAAGRTGYGSTGDPAADRAGYGAAGRPIYDPRGERNRKRVESRDRSSPPPTDSNSSAVGPSSGGFTPVGPPAVDRGPTGPGGAPASGAGSDHSGTTPPPGAATGDSTAGPSSDHSHDTVPTPPAGAGRGR